MLNGLGLGLVGTLLLPAGLPRLAAALTMVLWFTAPTIRRGVSGHSETTPTSAWAIGVLLTAAAAMFVGVDERGAMRAAAASGLLWMLGVWATRRVVAALRRRGRLQTPTVVVGSGKVGVELAAKLRAHPHFGLEPVGFLDARPPQAPSPLPVLGLPQDLPAVLLRLGVGHVIIAYGSADEAALVPVIRDLGSLPHPVKVMTLPRLYELAEPGDGDVWGYPLVPLRVHDPRSHPWHLKRAFDFVVALGLLVLTSPLLLLLAALIRVDSPGPVLFRQTRMGQWGLHFEILKLRTMRHGAAASGSWEAPADQVTRMCRFLRPTHLDELPQLLNVLRGEMSIVGPRPERPEYISEFEVRIPGYDERHRVPVGITGWAQVNGLWGDTSMDDRARLDNRYIERWSMALDMRILLRTIGTLAGGRADEGHDGGR